MPDYITGSMQQMDTDRESARPEPNQEAEIMAFLMKRLSGRHTCCGADIAMHTTVMPAFENTQCCWRRYRSLAAAFQEV